MGLARGQLWGHPGGSCPEVGASDAAADTWQYEEPGGGAAWAGAGPGGGGPGRRRGRAPGSRPARGPPALRGLRTLAGGRGRRARGLAESSSAGRGEGRGAEAAARRLAGSCAGAGRAAGSALARGELTKPRREGRLAARRPGPLAPPPRDFGAGPRPSDETPPLAPHRTPSRAARAQVAPRRPEAGPGGAGRRGAAPGAAMTAQRAPRARP